MVHQRTANVSVIVIVTHMHSIWYILAKTYFYRQKLFLPVQFFFKEKIVFFLSTFWQKSVNPAWNLYTCTRSLTRVSVNVAWLCLVCYVQFIREDLEHVDGAVIQANFHGSDDLISVHELWQIWINSAGQSSQYSFAIKQYCNVVVFMLNILSMEDIIKSQPSFGKMDYQPLFYLGACTKVIVVWLWWTFL